jgi:hypothetical protein
VKPLCIDLFCGLGGWTEGFLAEGYNVVGFDIEVRPYPAQLVIQDVLTIHGSQFRDAAVIVASPPCQQYSWLAMPWSRSTNPNNSKAAKALRKKWETEGPDNRLFDACFRIQREACEAAGRHIPMVVENVRGAIPWVGRSVWNYGSFHLWGDVPALMPISVKRALKQNPDGTGHPPGSWFAIADSVNRGQKTQGGSWFRERDGIPQPGIKHEDRGIKAGHPERSYRNGHKSTAHLTNAAEHGTKVGGDWFRDPACHQRHGSKSAARKIASAQIAKIPFVLANHIAQVYMPRESPRCQ